jgi:hypothetical protein
VEFDRKENSRSTLKRNFTNTVQPKPLKTMKKLKQIKSFAAMMLAFGFLSTVTLVSCGSNKDTDTTDQMEMEQPTPREGDHPMDADEHPMTDTVRTDTTSAE